MSAPASGAVLPPWPAFARACLGFWLIRAGQRGGGQRGGGRRRIRVSWFCLAAILLFWPLQGMALDLSLPPGAEMLRETQEEGSSAALPIEPWSEGSVQVQNVAGRITRQAWRMGATSLTTLQLMDRLSAQLDAAGYQALLRCEASACGGFDFRFALTVFPPPEMFVDLFDYRFLSVTRGKGDTAQYASLLISRAGDDIYLQTTEITPEAVAEGTESGSSIRPDQPDVSKPDAGAGAGMLRALSAAGRVVLSDLEFGTNDTTLGEGPFASLAALAQYLKADSGRRIALVGHSDTVGGYEANLVVSRRRAQAVMQRLRRAYDVPAAQLEADGVAYLAPVATNTSAEGREANRRVEAVLLSGGK